jgi:RNA polymerase sigma-70 factor, ECF subfamily
VVLRRRRWMQSVRRVISVYFTMKGPGTLREPRPAPEGTSQRWTGYLADMARGDETALENFFQETRSIVYGMALRILGDPARAEEATLDTFMQAWRQAAAYQEHRGSPMAWLVMLARSRAIDRRRSAARGTGTAESLDRVRDLADGGPSALEEYAGKKQRQAILSALGRLSKEQREAISIAFYEGLSHSEIAAHLGVPLGTIKTRIRAGMLRLRGLLADQNESGGV